MCKSYHLFVIINGRTVHSQELEMTEKEAVAYLWEYANLDSDSVKFRAVIENSDNRKDFVYYLIGEWQNKFEPEESTMAHYFLCEL